MTIATNEMGPQNWTSLGRQSLLAASAAMWASSSLASPIRNLKLRNATRRLRMLPVHTGETLDSVYWTNGRISASAQKAISWIMRDWRTGAAIPIDSRLIDILSAAHRRLRTARPLELVSGYRSPETNLILRVRSDGVAPRSPHMVGMAADIRIPGGTLDEISRAAEASGAGGIGTFPGPNFVHIDCGRQRSWQG